MKQQSRLSPPDFVPRCRWLNERLFTRVTQSSQQRGQPYCTALWKTLCSMEPIQLGNEPLILEIKQAQTTLDGARATSSSYPPSSDSMTNVPTLGMATSTVRWPGDSSSVTRSGGGVTGVFIWTSGSGEMGGGRDWRENGTDETGTMEDWWKQKEHYIGQRWNRKRKKVLIKRAHFISPHKTFLNYASNSESLLKLSGHSCGKVGQKVE